MNLSVLKGLSTHDVLHGVPSDEALDMSYLSEDAVVTYNLFCPKLVVIQEQEQYSKLCGCQSSLWSSGSQLVGRGTILKCFTFGFVQGFFLKLLHEMRLIKASNDIKQHKI